MSRSKAVSTVPTADPSVNGTRRVGVMDRSYAASRLRFSKELQDPGAASRTKFLLLAFAGTPDCAVRRVSVSDLSLVRQHLLLFSSQHFRIRHFHGVWRAYVCTTRTVQLQPVQESSYTYTSML
jgi:hypothetical protein